MKFIVTSNVLLKQLQMLSGVLNSSNTLPILHYFLFEIGQNEATISASDLETTMTTKMEIKSEEEGVIAMPAKLLIDTLKVLIVRINLKNIIMSYDKQFLNVGNSKKCYKYIS